jgi:hypothetical protein
MTRFTVVWHADATDELARLWIAATDRQALRSAADAIDYELAVDAPLKGSGIPDSLRQLTVAPLRVLFAVSEADRMVRVLEVACA